MRTAGRNEAPPVRRGAPATDVQTRGHYLAAMKPRLFDGEHGDPVKSTRPHFKRRNEAPPVRRGAPNQLGLTTGKVDAAMKPRLFDGEHAVIAHTPCQPLAPQ